MPDFSLETKITGKVAGTDEAGRGPWAGPVVAAAVIFLNYDAQPYHNLLDDSKKLSEKKRDELFNIITNDNNVIYHIATANNQQIDQLNILRATHLAMSDAINALTIKPDHVLIDGNQKIQDLAYNSETVIKGDSKSLSIAAASILAKVTRDKIMLELSELFPKYKWDKNKGYGTKDHINALNEFGPCKYHRASFRPIKELLSKAS